VNREERGQLHRKHYRCLTHKELRELQEAHIRQANEFLNVPPTTRPGWHLSFFHRPPHVCVCGGKVDTGLVRIVLKYFKWDVEKLLQNWMDEGKDKVFKQAGVQLHEEDEEKPQQQQQQQNAMDIAPKDCEICYSEISPSEVSTPPHSTRAHARTVTSCATSHTCLLCSRTRCRAGTAFAVIAGGSTSP
jgi:hypothetical protein